MARRPRNGNLQHPDDRWSLEKEKAGESTPTFRITK
jgi:hypothetical protein